MHAGPRAVGCHERARTGRRGRARRRGMSAAQTAAATRAGQFPWPLAWLIGGAALLSREPAILVVLGVTAVTGCVAELTARRARHERHRRDHARAAAGAPRSWSGAATSRARDPRAALAVCRLDTGARVLARAVAARVRRHPCLRQPVAERGARARAVAIAARSPSRGRRERAPA